MDVAGRRKIISVIVVLLLAVLAVLMVLPKQATAQGGSCSEAVGNCNYEFTTNGVTPSYVEADVVITSAMAVQSYGTGNQPMFSLQYNPDTNMVCNSNPFESDGSTGYWVQGVIIYNRTLFKG